MYIFRKSDYSLPLATKHNLEIKQQNERGGKKSINAHRNNGKLLKEKTPKKKNSEITEIVH